MNPKWKILFKHKSKYLAYSSTITKTKAISDLEAKGVDRDEAQIEVESWDILRGKKIQKKNKIRQQYLSGKETKDSCMQALIYAGYNAFDIVAIFKKWDNDKQ